ncbi:MAG: hypothetical protein KIS66_10665 [Fimbriimonadaceae bacterium]|nr:hypothetical protein [Fimbriimonadaceae bacterium]
MIPILLLASALSAQTSPQEEASVQARLGAFLDVAFAAPAARRDAIAISTSPVRLVSRGVALQRYVAGDFTVEFGPDGRIALLRLDAYGDRIRPIPDLTPLSPEACAEIAHRLARAHLPEPYRPILTPRSMGQTRVTYDLRAGLGELPIWRWAGASVTLDRISGCPTSFSGVIVLPRGLDAARATPRVSLEAARRTAMATYLAHRPMPSAVAKPIAFHLAVPFFDREDAVHAMTAVHRANFAARRLQAFAIVEFWGRNAEGATEVQTVYVDAVTGDPVAIDANEVTPMASDVAARLRAPREEPTSVVLLARQGDLRRALDGPGTLVGDVKGGIACWATQDDLLIRARLSDDGRFLDLRGRRYRLATPISESGRERLQLKPVRMRPGDPKRAG